MLYYEDLVVGTVTKSERTYEVTREEVIDFASKYDPQAFHLDDAAAAKTHFGRLSASGWHTAAMTMRMMVEGWKTQEPTAGLGSPVSMSCAGKSLSIRAIRFGWNQNSSPSAA